MSTERQIKFRAWEKASKRWITHSITISAEYHIFQMFVDDDNKFHCFPKKPEEVDIEQFTGLHDKNGVPIYEGDIVRWLHGTIDIAPVEYSVEDSFGSYPNTCFFGLRITRFAGLCQFQSDDEYEILGNIHENPELLNESNRS